VVERLLVVAVKQAVEPAVQVEPQPAAALAVQQVVRQVAG